MFRIAYPFILLFLSFITFSCNDPVDIEDPQAPVITIVSPTENSKVNGTITIAATAVGKSNKIHMQMYLDGILLKESSVGVINVEYDTKTLEEGIHSIKVMAKDKAGNTSQKTYNFEVRNILLRIQISSNYVPDYAQIYFTVSNNDGSIIEINQVKNGSIISVPTPQNFNLDSSFVFTEYFHLYIPASVSGIEVSAKTINVYAELGAGEFKLAEYYTPPPTIGTHQVKVTEVPTEHFASLSSGEGSSNVGYFGSDGSFIRDLSMSKNISDLFFWLREGKALPVYKYVNSIQVGGSSLFSCIGLPQMQKAEVTTRDGLGNYNYSITTESSINVFKDEGNFDGGKIPLYFPSTVFPNYVFDLSYQLGNDYYQNRLRGSIPPTSFQYLTAAVSGVNYKNQQLEVLSTGAFDIMTIAGSTSSFDGVTFLYSAHTVSFPNGTKNKVIIPNTPSQLASFDFLTPRDFNFTDVAFYDYLTLSSNEYQNKIVFSEDNVLRQNREFISGTMQYVIPGANGRLSTNKKMKLPEYLEITLRTRLSERF